MPTKQRLDQVRNRLEHLRHDALEMVTSVNKVVFGGVQRLADHELRTLNQAYATALRSLRTARKTPKGNLKDLSALQIDTLQELADQVIANARQAIKIVAETRSQLTETVKKGGKATTRELTRAVAPARRELKRTGTAARKAATKSRQVTRKTKRKTATSSRPAARPAARRPSPNSRAGRATTRAKRAAKTAVRQGNTTLPSSSRT